MRGSKRQRKKLAKKAREHARAFSYNKLVYRTLWDCWTSDPKVQQPILDRRSGKAYSRLW